jgi:hypothetical protein
MLKAVKTKTRTEALAPLRRQLAMARTELRELYELAEQTILNAVNVALES